MHADFHAAAFTTLKGDPAILFGTDGGLFVSTDGARSFSSQKNDGISSYLIYALTGNPKHPDDVFIGLQDDGTRWREGKTGTYNQVLGGDGFGVAWSQSRDRVSLASVYYSYIVRDMMNPPTTQAKWRVGWTGIAEFFNPALTYFNTCAGHTAGIRGSRRTDVLPPHPLPALSHDQRRGELDVCDGDAAGDHSSGGGVVTVCAAARSTRHAAAPRRCSRAGSHPIGISPEDLDHFGVLANGGWFYSTVDGGATWTSRNLTTIAPGVARIQRDSGLREQHEAVRGATRRQSARASRALKSLDGGATWTSINNGLPPVPISKLIVSPRDPSGNTVYAGTWLGVYETTDGGTSWHLVWQRTARGRGQRSVHADRWQLPSRVDIRPRRLGNAFLTDLSQLK